MFQKRFPLLISILLSSSTTIYSQWSKIDTMFYPSSHPTCTVVDNFIYVQGGLGGWDKNTNLSPSYGSYPEVYNLLTKQWHVGIQGAMFNFTNPAVTVGSKVVISSPSPGTNVKVFDDTKTINSPTSAWTLTAYDATAAMVSMYSGVNVSGLAVFAGNSNPSVAFYNIATDSWTTANLSQPRDGLASVSNGTKAFFAGGWRDVLPPVYYDVVDIYDSSTKKWSTTKLSKARAFLSATSVGSKVFFAGGFDGTLDSDVIDIYDTNTNTWSVIHMSVERSYVAAASAGNKAFFGSGTQLYDPVKNLNAEGKTLDIIDVYDNNTGIWSTLTMPTARYYAGAIGFQNQLFFIGGQDSPRIFEQFNYAKLLNTIDVYSVQNSNCTSPSKPVITILNNNTSTPVLSSSYSSGNQWFYNGKALEGFTSSTLNITDLEFYSGGGIGNYMVQTTVNGCATPKSDPLVIAVTGVTKSDELPVVYPTITSDFLYIQGTNPGQSNIAVIDTEGRLILEEIRDLESPFQVDVRNLSQGLYILKLVGKSSHAFRFIKK